MLTDTKLRNLKPRDKLYKVNDRDGLYVAVTPAGAVSFRYNYSLNGRQETITFGRYGVGSQMQQGFQERVAETTGGKLAAGIWANMEPEGRTEQSAGGQQFEGNSLGGDAGTSDKSSGGWINQTGGFSALSESDQAQAMESHAQWQARSEGNTFGVEDYVSYAQERQQARNAEVASFVNNENKNDRG